jgi:hypothetical protein
MAALTSGTEVGSFDTGGLAGRSVVAGGCSGAGTAAATATGATGVFLATALTDTVFMGAFATVFGAGLRTTFVARLGVAALVAALLAGCFAEVDRELVRWRRCMDLPGGLGGITLENRA